MKFFSVAIISALIASVAATSCSKSQFSHDSPKTGSCCLNNGGQSNPPSPPSGKNCPTQFQWHGGFECCVPTTPSAPTSPTCSKGSWDHSNQCCNEPTKPGNPTPSKRATHGKRSQGDVARLASRNWRSKTLSCPTGQSVCNVSDGVSKTNTWACVDTMKDVNFCGGCAGLNAPGSDCSAIPFVWNAVCDMGECKVISCEPGFRPSHNGRKCIAME